MDNTQKFSGKADVYQKARPSYAQAMLEFIAQKWQIGEGSLVADIGSGTGILTRQLLGLGAKVFAVEPNADMRAKAEELLGGDPNFVSVIGTAEQTSLPDHSFHLVTAASAFHWFDPERFRQECDRILLIGAPVVLLWNEARISEEINLGRERIYKNYCPNFKGFSGGREGRNHARRAFFGEEIQEQRFPTHLATTGKPLSIARYPVHILSLKQIRILKLTWRSSVNSSISLRLTEKLCFPRTALFISRVVRY